MRFRKMMSLLLVSLLMVSVVSTASASKSSPNSPGRKTVELGPQEAMEFATANNMEMPAGGKLVKLVLVETKPKADQTEEPPGDISPQWGEGYYVKNISWTDGCGSSAIRKTSAVGPGTLGMTVTESVAAKWGADVGISAGEVSIGVGFSVTSTFTVEDSFETEVPSGELWELRAYPRYDIANFEVWYDPYVGFDYYAGDGYAMQPIGVCFAIFEY